MRFRLAILFFIFTFNSSYLYSQKVPVEVEFASLLSKSETYLLKNDIQNAVSCLNQCLNINPKSSVANYQLARIYNSQRDIEAALNYANKAYKLNPENIYYSELLSDLYFNRRDGSNFHKYKLLSLPKSPTYEYYLDWFQMLQAFRLDLFFHEKLFVLDEMEKSFGYDLFIGNNRAMVYELNKDLKNAEVEFIRLSRTDSSDLRLMFQLKNFYDRNGKTANAQEVQKIIDSQNSKNISGYVSDNLMYLSSGKMDLFYENLIESFRNDEEFTVQQKLLNLQEIISRPISLNFDSICQAFEVLCETYSSDLLPYLNYSSYLMMNDQTEKTIEVLKSAIDVDKSNFEIWKRLFKVLTITEEYPDLFDLTNQALDCFPEMSEVYLFHGIANIYLGRLKDANDDLQTSIDMGLMFTDSYSHYTFYNGVLLYLQGDSGAFDWFRTYENFHIDDYYLQIQYAYFIIDSGKNLRHAESIINHYANDPNLNYYFYFVRAYFHLKSNNLEQSRDDIQEAINMDSSKYHVYNLAGDIFAKSGDCTNAVVYWNQAIDRGGNSTLISKKIQNCKK